MEIKVVQHIDDQTFTAIQRFELPFEHVDIHEPEKNTLLRKFAEAFATAEVAADKVWQKLGANNPIRMHTRKECTNPSCRIHPR